MLFRSATRTGEQPDLTEYPDSDDVPVALTPAEHRWLARRRGELDEFFLEHPEVLVLEGRDSFKIWMSNGKCPLVVFEILANDIIQEPSMMRRLWEVQGVEEYYVFNPNDDGLRGYILKAGAFQPITDINRWTSPRLGITFVYDERRKLKIRKPDGTFFRTTAELISET